MEKTLRFVIVGLFIIFMVGAVSAKTVVTGTIYNEDYSEKIEDADVMITCMHNGIGNIQNTTSISEGSYAVEFYDSKCNTGDSVVVVVIKDDLSGSGSGVVLDKDLFPGVDINLAIVNIPMTPEFGFIVGALTLFSALGIFFVVRRKD